MILTWPGTCICACARAVTAADEETEEAVPLAARGWPRGGGDGRPAAPLRRTAAEFIGRGIGARLRGPAWAVGA